MELLESANMLFYMVNRAAVETPMEAIDRVVLFRPQSFVRVIVKLLPGSNKYSQHSLHIVNRFVL